MPTLENATAPEQYLPQPDSGFSHPPFPTNAHDLKELLIKLSKRPEHAAFRPILRQAADSIREKAFGYNRAATKRKILKLLSEFHICEIDDFLAETKIPESEIRAALAELAAEEKITVGRRRRWQELGKHYNEIFELADVPASDILS